MALALLFCAGGASAQVASDADPQLAARTVGYEGIEAYQAGDYVRADQKLAQAYRLLPVPSLGLWSARALDKLGFLVEASRRYTEAARSTLLAGDTDVQRKAKAEAQTELAALLPRIPRIELRLAAGSWQNVTLRVDGIEVPGAAREAPLLVNPGEHSIEARRGKQTVTRRVSAVPFEVRAAVLDFPEADLPEAELAAAPAPAAVVARADESASTEGLTEPASGDVWRTMGWVGVGVGGGALLLGGLTGIVAWSRLDEFDCGGKQCVSPDRDAVDSYNALVTTSTVGFVAGGVLAGAGAVLLFRQQLWASDVTVGVGGQSVTLAGRF